MNTEKNNQRLIDIIGRNIREIREQKGLSRSDVAKELNITLQAISQYENCKRLPNDKVLAELADFFSVNVTDLIKITPSKKSIIQRILDISLVKGLSFEDIENATEVPKEELKKVYAEDTSISTLYFKQLCKFTGYTEKQIDFIISCSDMQGFGLQAANAPMPKTPRYILFGARDNLAFEHFHSFFKISSYRYKELEEKDILLLYLHSIQSLREEIFNLLGRDEEADQYWADFNPLNALNSPHNEDIPPID